MMNKLREQVVRQYCRSVLWIDDEILKNSNTGTVLQNYFDFFVRIAHEFHEQGVLCSLRHFPQGDAANDDPYSDSAPLKSSKELASKADVVIVDWMLGCDTPTNCINILKHLIQIGGTRFLVILSKESTASETFRQEFPEFSLVEGGWYANKQGIFITIKKKDNFISKGAQGNSVKNLLNEIFSFLGGTYNDYLHWAALEIAARIKEVAPGWVASLPSETDLGLLAEHVHSDESVGETVFENLMGDLLFTLDPQSIESLKKNQLDPENWGEKDNFIDNLEKELEPLDEEVQTDLKLKINGVIPYYKKDDSDVIATEDFRELKVLSEQNSLKTINRFFKEHERFVQFCEVVSLSDSNAVYLKRGSVCVSHTHQGGSPKNIWICVSQACDCVRADHLMFIKGKKVDAVSNRGSKAYVRFQDCLYEFVHSASSLLTCQINKDRTPKEKKCVGYLRRDVVDRLSTRFWAHITRVGVNLPVLERNFRPKEI